MTDAILIMPADFSHAEKIPVAERVGRAAGSVFYKRLADCKNSVGGKPVFLIGQRETRKRNIGAVVIFISQRVGINQPHIGVIIQLLIKNEDVVIRQRLG